MRTLTQLSFFLILPLFVMSGCVTSEAQRSAYLSSESLAWRDDSFSYTPELVTLKQADLFLLPPDLQEKITKSLLPGMTMHTRFNRMLTIIYGENQVIFPYIAGHSTRTADTWKNKQGDCISLTLLTYSVARAMNIPVQMQEVRSPTLFDRRNQVDFINDHVNLLVKNTVPFDIKDKSISAHDFVIDFEPEQTAYVQGTTLTEAGITARFYNNLGAEYLAKGQVTLAYAYFKQAALTDPTFAKSYTNLAQLYKNNHLLADAEKMLLHSLAVAPNSEITIRSLMELMAEQKRSKEQQYYAALLQESQKNDPYYWLGMGINQLKNQQYKEAITALKQASLMTHGFEEVHANLAIAYWRDKQPDKAREQLAILADLHPGSQRVSSLSKKFQTPMDVPNSIVKPAQ